MDIRLAGLRNLRSRLNNMRNNLDNKVNRAIGDVAFDLLGKSVPLAPVDSGDLRGSGNVQLGDKTASVGFNTPYAIKQHEDLTYNHPQGGQAKYLEEPFDQNKERYKEHIKNAAREVLR